VGSFLSRRGRCLAFLQTLSSWTTECSSPDNASELKLNPHRVPREGWQAPEDWPAQNSARPRFCHRTGPVQQGGGSTGPWAYLHAEHCALNSLLLSFNLDSPLPRRSNSCVVTQGAGSKGWSSWAMTALFTKAVCGWLRHQIWLTAESHRRNPRRGVRMGGGARMGRSGPNRDWFTLTRISIHGPTPDSGCCANSHPWWPAWIQMCT